MSDKRRRTANMTERLAAAYIALGLVPEPLRSRGTAKEIERYVQADHNFPHALGGDTRPQNLNLLPKSIHAQKTRRDIAAIAKAKRLADKYAEHRRRLLAKNEGAPIAAPRLTRKGNRPLPCGRFDDWRKPLGSFIAVRRGK